MAIYNFICHIIVKSFLRIAICFAGIFIIVTLRAVRSSKQDYFTSSIHSNLLFNK